MKDEDRIADFVDRVEECWIRLDLEPVVRRRLLDELQADLKAARASGASADDLVRADAVAFAVEVARAEGALPPSGKRRIEMSELTSVALASGFAGAFLSWFVIYRNQSLFEMLRQWLPEAAASLTMNAAAGGLTLLAIMAGIRVFYRRQAHAPGLALRTAAWALAGGVLSVIPAVAVAAAMNYPFDATIVGLESVIVASCVIGAIRLGNRLRPFTVIPRPQ